jgi:hypothetical protein
MIIYYSKQDWLRDCMKTAKASVERKIHEERIIGERFYLANTEYGAREYWRTFGREPVIMAGMIDEYSSLESEGHKHFIFLADVLVNYGAEGDIVATLLHEMLHAIIPDLVEGSVRELEDYCCEEDGIQRDRLLDNLSA